MYTCNRRSENAFSAGGWGWAWGNIPSFRSPPLPGPLTSHHLPSNNPAPAGCWTLWAASCHHAFVWMSSLLCPPWQGNSGEPTPLSQDPCVPHTEIPVLGLGCEQQQILTTIYDTDQQGPTVWHKELYSMSCNKLQWKKYEKEYIFMQTESLCCIHHKLTANKNKTQNLITKQ